MKKFTIVAAAVFMSSCGLQYTPAVNITDISKVDFHTDLEKSAKNCAYGVLWFPPFAGSSSSGIEIAKEARFSKVSAVDYQSDFLILFNRSCAIVYGK